MVAPLDTDVAIETPEHIVFHYRVAGPARRALAYTIDLLACYGAVAVVGLIVMLAFVGDVQAREIRSTAKAGGGFVLLALFAAQWVYFVVYEARTGRSLGKRALGLRVVSTTGRPIGWRAAALRNLLRAADALPIGYVVGLVSMTISSRFQRLGDLVAATIVVAPEAVRVARPIELRPAASPKEVAALPDTVTLDAEEREAIELFLRRRQALSPMREHELASMIAVPIGKRFGFVHPDPSRLLAIVYDRAANEGRIDAPPSSWGPRALKRKGLPAARKMGSP